MHCLLPLGLTCVNCKSRMVERDSETDPTEKEILGVFQFPKSVENHGKMWRFIFRAHDSRAPLHEFLKDLK